jgi:hypothetical protein
MMVAEIWQINPGTSASNIIESVAASANDCAKAAGRNDCQERLAAGCSCFSEDGGRKLAIARPS